MESGTVSVIIPTYNRAYCLPRAIRSVQAQTFSKWQAWVIDDGSTDETEDRVRAIAASDGRVRYYRQDNAGVSAARNAGLRLADGDWIAFLDSDDTWEPWKLDAQLACFRAAPGVGMIWTDMEAYGQDGTLLSHRYLRRMYTAYNRVSRDCLFEHERRVYDFMPDLSSPHLSEAVLRSGNLYTAMIFGNLVHTSTVLLSKERLRKVGFFNQAYRSGEDYDFHLRTCLHGPVALLDVPSIQYRSGQKDQLTAEEYELEIAMNALRTRNEAIASNRNRIRLSDENLAEILAGANAAVAEALFAKGNFTEARSYFHRGRLLRHRRLAPIVKASLCHLPLGVAKPLVRLLRKGKATVGHWRES